MKSKFSLALTTLLFLSSCASTPTSKSADKLVGGAAQATNSPDSISIDASQNIQFPMTAKEKKKLQADFKKASTNEQRSLAKQERASMTAFNKEQKVAKTAWTEQEKKARRVFFEQHMSGPERRQYIQDFLKRKDAFENEQKAAVNSQKNSWKEKREHLTSLQKERKVQFEALLSQGKRPNASLWPKE